MREKVKRRVFFEEIKKKVKKKIDLFCSIFLLHHLI